MEEEFYNKDDELQMYQLNDTEEFKEEDFATDYHYSPKKSQQNILSRVFLFQTFICVALVSALAGLHFVLPDVYVEIQEELSTAGQGISVHNGISEGYTKIVSFIEGLKPLKVNQEESPDEGESTAELPLNCSLENIAYDGEAVLPLEGVVTSAYGFRKSPIDEKEEFHSGVDIAAEEGTIVVSMDSGTVETSEFDENYGNYLMINHANGFSSVYAHCLELSIGKGESVDKGQAIATVGSTGNSTGPHLHFGIKKDGVYINPGATFPEYI